MTAARKPSHGPLSQRSRRADAPRASCRPFILASLLLLATGCGQGPALRPGGGPGAGVAPPWLEQLWAAHGVRGPVDGSRVMRMRYRLRIREVEALFEEVAFRLDDPRSIWIRPPAGSPATVDSSGRLRLDASVPHGALFGALPLEALAAVSGETLFVRDGDTRLVEFALRSLRPLACFPLILTRGAWTLRALQAPPDIITPLEVEVTAGEAWRPFGACRLILSPGTGLLERAQYFGAARPGATRVEEVVFEDYAEASGLQVARLRRRIEAHQKEDPIFQGDPSAASGREVLTVEEVTSFEVLAGEAAADYCAEPGGAHEPEGS